MTGFLNLFKPEGMSSAQAVNKVKWLTRERPTGTFARQLTLGNRVAVDQISAEYADGVLSLTIPVADDAKPFRFADVGPNAWRFCDWKDL